MRHEDFLFLITDTLTENKIPNALFAGTLLGAIREKTFIPGDNYDTDIIVPLKYYYQVKTILELLAKEGKFEMYMYWRREIAIRTLNHSIKVDIFFIETKNKITSFYDYKRNSATGIYDIERKWDLKTMDVLPFKKSKFYNHSVYIPNNPENIFKVEYGEDWKIPNPKWEHDSSTIIDKDYREFAIIIPTFLRPEKIEREINSILQSCHPESYRLYIGDQSNEFSQSALAKSLKELGHHIYDIPFNSGLSFTRNFLVKQTKEPLILVIDDDYVFNNATDLFTFGRLLLENEDIGLIGGLVSNRGSYSHDLCLNNDNHKLYFIKDETKPFIIFKFRAKSYKYQYCDSIMNFFLSKREVFDDIQWDNDLKLAEHTDFLLRLKDTRWKVIYTPDVSLNEMDEKAVNPIYVKYRGTINSNPSLKLFYKKHGLKDDNDIIRITISKPEESAINDFTNKLLEQNIPINNLLVNLMQTLEVWFLNQSCLEAINYNEIRTNKIYLGVRNEQIKLLVEEYFKTNINILGLEYKITIEPNRKIRWSGTFRVPIPVVPYLQQLYGNDWENIKIGEK